MPNAPANMGANAAAAAVKQAVAAGAPKSIRNRLRNAATSLKSGASELGRWMKRKFMGRNAAGNSRWTRYGRKISNHLNRYRILNRFRPGAATRRGTAAGKAALQRLRNRETLDAQLAIAYPRPPGVTRRSTRR